MLIKVFPSLVFPLFNYLCKLCLVYIRCSFHNNLFSNLHCTFSFIRPQNGLYCKVKFLKSRFLKISTFRKVTGKIFVCECFSSIDHLSLACLCGIEPSFLLVIIQDICFQSRKWPLHQKYVFILIKNLVVNFSRFHLIYFFCVFLSLRIIGELLLIFTRRD